MIILIAGMRHRRRCRRSQHTHLLLLFISITRYFWLWLSAFYSRALFLLFIYLFPILIRLFLLDAVLWYVFPSIRNVLYMDVYIVHIG